LYRSLAASSFFWQAAPIPRFTLAMLVNLRPQRLHRIAFPSDSLANTAL